MSTIILCLAAAVVALSTLARLNDLPRAGGHTVKIGLALCGASAILIALLVFFGRNVPIWLLAASVVGCALDKVGAAPFTWWRWILHGERRKRSSYGGIGGPAVPRRRSTDNRTRASAHQPGGTS